MKYRPFLRSFSICCCVFVAGFGGSGFTGSLQEVCRAGDSPDECDQASEIQHPVDVYILLGQSNMLGFGKIGPEGEDGTLEHAVRRKRKYPYLLDDSGEWSVRRDVRFVRVMGSGTGPMKLIADEWLTVPKRRIGPELGIGHVLGDASDAPVLLLKSCIGNRSLGWDLLPPGSESFEHDGMIYAGYRQSPLSWEKGTEPEPINWYAGKQYDGDIANAKSVLSEENRFRAAEANPESESENAQISALRSRVAELEEFARRARFTAEGLKEHNRQVEALRGRISDLLAEVRGYRIAGFFFWQGDKDRYNEAHAMRYEQNLVRLIRQLREDFDAPNAPFVCATLGQTERGSSGNEGLILNAQLAVDGASGTYPEFAGNVATVYSFPLCQGGASNSHYNGNAETYTDIGEAMGRAMVKLRTQQSEASD